MNHREPAVEGRPWPLVPVLVALLVLGAAAAAGAFVVLLLYGTSSGPPRGAMDSSSAPAVSIGPEVGGVAVEPVIEGLERPLALAFLGGPDDPILVAQQAGLILSVEGGEISEVPALDLSDVTLSGGEQGVLGLALHPDFAENGRLFVSYVHVDGATILAEYTAPDGIHADPATVRELLRLPQGASRHKAGALVFAEDGTLFMSIGDDAWPKGTTPDYTDDFRGTIIRIDVDGGDGDRPYGIPEGNPFADGGGPPEVYHYGLRNPWRISIDPATGDMYIADVGSERYEEVSRHRASVPPPLDFGWGAWEGFECRRHQIRSELNCDDWADAEPPILVIQGGEFASGDCAIIGGYVYHGSGVPALAGQYVFGDYCSGRIRAVPTDVERPTPRVMLDSEVRIGTFGIDTAGELYVTDVDNGIVYRLVGD